jgi:2-polyprenyl-3-methyl-5-hydroxy-6-metoxy-1,4-benzoquinol methylase
MSKLISEDYLAQNISLHKNKATYGAGGGKWADFVAQIAAKYELKSILDYGCGKGMLETAIKKMALPLKVTSYDPAMEAFSHYPVHQHDLVTCIDVMEHVEPASVPAVLTELHRLARHYVFLVVATRPAKKTLPDGRNAHLITENRYWWQDAFHHRFHLKALFPGRVKGEFSILLKPRSIL